MTMCSFCDRTEGLCLCVRSDRLEPFTSDSRDKKVTVDSHVDFCVANAHSVTGLPQRKA